jgi:hypothetical protein
MITLQEHTGFIKVEEYSLAGWLAEVETVIKQGYTFDFESNETHPQAFGSMYTVLMVPDIRFDAYAAPEAPWGNPNDLSKALNLLQKESNVEDKPANAVTTPKVDGRKKK